MEAIFDPGMTAAIHRHAGPEAFYTVTGETCLETPDGVLTGRARKTTPTTNAPTAPMPVHTAYAVPKGSVRIDTESSAKLTTRQTNVTTLGPTRVEG
jgi:hypothetical protein